MVAGGADGRYRQVHGRLAAGDGDGGDAVFESADTLFEHRVGGVRQARIDVPRALDVEQSDGEIAVREHERRRLVDRRRAGTGGGVRPLARVQGEGVESGAAGSLMFVVGHARILTAGPGSRGIRPAWVVENNAPNPGRVAGRKPGCPVESPFRSATGI